MPETLKMGTITATEHRQRVQTVLADYLQADQRMTDHLFAGLLLVQWVAAVAIALWVSPLTWEGSSFDVHLHVKLALLLGAVLSLVPTYLAVIMPGRALTRHVIAVAQMLWSGLLIHLTGGRIETHFHVFGSLAFLAFYRDWKVILTATIVAVADHLIRGLWMPLSVFGQTEPGLWLALEHGSWVLFEDFFLIIAIRQRLSELSAIAERQVWQDEVQSWTEQEIEQRTHELTEKRAELEAMNDASPLGIFRTNAAGANTYVNAMYTQITSLTNAEAIGGGWRHVVHPDDLAEVLDLWTFATTNGTIYTHSHRILRGDSQLAWISVHAAPMRQDGRIIGYVGTVQDITHRQRIEEQLRQASDAALAANAAKSSFLANMSHELRTPMTAILGFIDILLGRLHHPEEQDAAHTIKRNAEWLLSLINDILDLSKIEAGKLDTERVDFAPTELLHEVVSLMRVRATAKRLQLNLQFASALPRKICSDPLRLRQVLVNLLGNAIKFTEHGEVRIIAQLLPFADAAPQLRVDIIDTGIGMTAEQQAKLFQPFTQADSSMTRRYGGTGLGLTISKRLIELLGGQIEVTSIANQGSTFSVILDLDPATTDSSSGSFEIVSEAEPTPTPATRLSANILLAEDGPDNRRLIEYILRKAGAEVTAVEDGAAAIQAIAQRKADERPFDIVLMDMHMPVVDGYSATRRLRELGNQLPIIALTANAMSNDRQLCLDAGCTDYATKPLQRELLLAMIERYTSASATSLAHP